MCWTILAAGLCFQISDDKLRKGFFSLFFLLFTLAYSIGEGPIAFTMTSEVFPLVNREVGMSFGVRKRYIAVHSFYLCRGLIAP